MRMQERHAGAAEIRTARLTIIPFARDLALAALRDRAELARRLGGIVPDGWPGPEMTGYMPAYTGELAEQPERSTWVRLALRTADRALIGDMGFHGPPDGQGTVELGYSIAPAYRRQGYATEGARGLVAWAFAQPRVRRVFADCLATNPASARVLAKLGLRPIPPQGQYLNWELTAREYAARAERR
jgi:RimJ/RimL family protein N-acetyltransferase